MKYAFITVAMILFMAAAPALAGRIETILVPPQETLAAGSRASFTLYLNNFTEQKVSTRAYDQLDVTLSNGVRTERMTATRRGTGPIVIRAEGFTKETFVFTIPPDMTGSVKLSLAGVESNHGLFSVEAAPPADAPGKQIALEEAVSMFQPFVEKISSHEPMYFLLGVDPGIEKSSFQLSFKYQFFNSEGFLADNAPWIDGFYLGYTQKSLWDLDSDSAPFEDTSYKPELFYLADNIDLGLPWVSFFALQAGYQHESNGQDDPESRSTNHLYIKPIFGFNLWDDVYMKLAPKVWAYVNNDDDTNPDLEDFRGYFEIEAKIGSPQGFVLASLFRHGDEGGTYQFDLSYPLNQLFGRSLDMYIHAQYFNGYAETLLDYNQKDDAFRLGISIVR